MDRILHNYVDLHIFFIFIQNVQEFSIVTYIQRQSKEEARKDEYRIFEEIQL